MLHPVCVGLLRSALCALQVPSWAILTNGLNYKFYQYIIETDTQGERSKQLLQSHTTTLLLTKGSSAADAKEAVIPVVAFVRYILEKQKAAMDNMEKAQCAKKPR